MVKYSVKEVVRTIKGRRFVFRVGDKVAVPWSREGKTLGKIDSIAMISDRSDGRWGRTNSLAEAKKAVDKYGGTIRSMSLFSGRGAWDAPTFRVSSDLVPYTPRKPRVRLTKANGTRRRKK